MAAPSDDPDDITNNMSFGNSEGSSEQVNNHHDGEEDLSEADDIHEDTDIGEDFGDLCVEDLAAGDGGSDRSPPDLRSSSISFHGSQLECELGADGLEGSGIVMDKGEVRKSIQKGKSELTRSRQKAHAKAGGDHGMEPSSGRPSSVSNGRKLPASSHSSSGKSRSSKSRPASGEDPNGFASSHSSMGDGDPMSKAGSSKKSSRKFPDEEGKKSRSHSHSQAGSLATPRKKGGKKKISLDEMSAAQAPDVGELPAFCTPRRPSSSRHLQVDTKSMIAGVGGPTTKTPKRTQSLQTKWRTSKAAHTSSQEKNRGTGTSSAQDAMRKSASWDDMNQSGVSAVSVATLQMSNAAPPAGTVSDSHERATSSSHDKADVDDHDAWQNENKNDYDEEPSEAKSEEMITSNVPGEMEQQTEGDPQEQSFSNLAQNKTNNTALENSSELANDGSGETQGEQQSSEALQIVKASEVDYWSCWSCEYDNNILAHVFCGMCGTGRDWICPSCQHENKSSFNFCGMCGTRKGYAILHKEQAEAFDMRTLTRKTSTTQQPRLPPKKLSRDSTSGRGSIRAAANQAAAHAPPSPTRSVGTAPSSSRRPSARTRRPSDDNASLLSDSKSMLRSGEDGSQRDGEKRSSRGRGRGREEGKESKSGDAKSRQKKPPARSRSSSRPIGERGRENRKSRDPSERDGAKGDRKHRPLKRKGDKVRRTLDSTSVPAGDRRATKGNADAAITAHAERQQLQRSNSLSAEELQLQRSGSLSALNSEAPNHYYNASTGPLIAGDADEQLEGVKSNKSWLNQGMWQPEAAVGTGQVPRDSYANRMGDILATPNIKKRLLKMGGKVKGVGGKLFKGPGIPMMHDDVNEAAPSQPPLPPLPRVPSATSDTLENATKITPEGNYVPETPSLKKRLLKMNPWGKSEHGKPAVGAPLIDDTFQSEPFQAEEEEETEEIEPMDFADFDDNPLVGIRTEIVVTAKDVRPNRPVVSRHPQRRRSGKGSLMGTQDERRDRRSSHTNPTQRRPRRAKSGDSTTLPRRKHREPSVDSDNSSSVSDNIGRGADAGKHDDPLGDRTSEAESINSVDFDQ